MYGHTIHFRLDDYLNKVAYPVEAPAYSIKKHEVFKEGILEPWHIPDRNAVVLTRATIAKMVEMHSDTIPFKIVNRNDITEIYQYLSEYLRELTQYLEIAEARDYYSKANKFLDVLRRSLHILANTDPVAKKLVENLSISDMFRPIS